MSNALIALLILALGVALATILILLLFRLALKIFGVSQIAKEGIVLTESGLRYGGFLSLVKVEANYNDIKSVEILPMHVGFVKCMLYYNGIRSRWIRRTMCGDIVVITFKRSPFYKRLLFTPKDPTAFVQELRRRIEQAEPT